MNGWLLAAVVVLVAGVGATVREVATGPLRRRAAAQNLSTALACPALLLLAQGFHRPAYVDLALMLAVLGPVGTLVFARLLADELTDDPPHARGPTWTAAAVGAAVVVAVGVATGPGRALVKLLVIGALLVGGNLVASRALAGGMQEGRRD